MDESKYSKYLNIRICLRVYIATLGGYEWNKGGFCAPNHTIILINDIIFVMKSTLLEL